MDRIVSLLLSAVAVILGIVVHESAHALVAYLLGDSTARSRGRFSLNPLNHIDPFGTVVLPLLLMLAGGPVFAYAKPVPVYLGNLKNPKRDEVLVALAGPVSNILLAAVAAALYGMLRPVLLAGALSFQLASLLASFFITALLTNLSSPSSTSSPCRLSTVRPSSCPSSKAMHCASIGAFRLTRCPSSSSCCTCCPRSRGLTSSASISISRCIRLQTGCSHSFSADGALNLLSWNAYVGALSSEGIWGRDMSYRVTTQVYSGPFDLLLQLVSRQKVDIGAISISEVTEQYLEEVERLEALDLDVASDFLLVAATLLDIKAASLVPDEGPRTVEDDDSDDEELASLDGDALREVLIQRLIAYKQFKAAAAALGSRMEAERRMHPRVAGPDPEFLGLMPDYLAGITLRGLAVICADLDSRRETFLLEAEHVAPKRLPLELTVASVDRFTMARPTTTFRELLDEGATTEQLVATFLAILELAKRGSVTLAQDENFGEIQIERVEGAPAYHPGDALAIEETDE